MERIGSHYKKEEKTMNIERLLRKEIVDELEMLGKIQIGSEDYKSAVDGLTKLMDRAIEMEKFDREMDEKIKSREDEKCLRIQELYENQKNRKLSNYIAIGGLVIPAILTVWGTIKTINFEKEGTITTIMGRGFINKLLPKK